ncbi:hypothetical protein ACSBR2_016617 [Camellia fascicularis]
MTMEVMLTCQLCLRDRRNNALQYSRSLASHTWFLPSGCIVDPFIFCLTLHVFCLTLHSGFGNYPFASLLVSFWLNEYVSAPVCQLEMKVIAELEDPTVSQYCALCLLQAELDESLYELAGELV